MSNRKLEIVIRINKFGIFYAFCFVHFLITFFHQSNPNTYTFCSKSPKLSNKTHKLIFNWINLFFLLWNSPHFLQRICVNAYSFFKTLFVSQWRYGLQLLQWIFFYSLSLDLKSASQSNLSFENRKMSQKAKSGKYDAWGMIFVEFWPKSCVSALMCEMI